MALVTLGTVNISLLEPNLNSSNIQRDLSHIHIDNLTQSYFTKYIRISNVTNKMVAVPISDLINDGTINIITNSQYYQVNNKHYIYNYGDFGFTHFIIFPKTKMVVDNINISSGFPLYSQPKRKEVFQTSIVKIDGLYVVVPHEDSFCQTVIESLSFNVIQSYWNLPKTNHRKETKYTNLNYCLNIKKPIISDGMLELD
jgi:hypothetical protein